MQVSHDVVSVESSSLLPYRTTIVVHLFNRDYSLADKSANMRTEQLI